MQFFKTRFVVAISILCSFVVARIGAQTHPQITLESRSNPCAHFRQWHA